MDNYYLIDIEGLKRYDHNLWEKIADNVVAEIPSLNGYATEQYVDDKIPTWHYLGSITGINNPINLPTNFEEIYVRAYFDNWLSLSISFPKLALDASETRHFYTGKGIYSGSFYADELMVTVNGTTSLQLGGWMHNEGSTTAQDLSGNATLDVFYR